MGLTIAPSQPSHKRVELSYTSLDGLKEARPYQVDGVNFLWDTDGSAILADQMRLGKTPQALMFLYNKLLWLQEHDPAGFDAFSCLVLVRSANIWQWVREIHTWVSKLPNAVWTVKGTKAWVPPGFKIYVCSMDTFGRKGMSDMFLSFGFKQVIIDECHSFKNPDSQRTKALMAFVRSIERKELTQTIPFVCHNPDCKTTWDVEIEVKVSALEATRRTYKTSSCPKCYTQVQQSSAAHLKVKRQCNVMMLSGTPIANHADEWHVPLSLTAPEPETSIGSQAQFRRRWLEQDAKGRYSRINKYAKSAFFDMIKPFFLRRQKEDVYTDLPKLNHVYTVIDIEWDERLASIYNNIVGELELMAAKKPNLSMFESIGQFQRLRQVCGLAKCLHAAEYADEFVESNGEAKLAIAYHHHSVRESLQDLLKEYGTCKIDGTDSPQTKDRIAHQYFPKSQEQMLLLSIMAAKEGLELPYIDTMLVMEREWRSIDEEQVEYRVYNPDKDYLERRGLNREKVTTIEYILAKGTTDEYMHDITLEKAQLTTEAYGKTWDMYDQASFQELLTRTLSSRVKASTK